MTEKEIEVEIVAHENRNLSLLEDLKSKGVSLDVPRNTEHHFWTGSQKDAVLLANELYKNGFMILVLSPCEDDDQWNIEAGKKMMPMEVASRNIVDRLVRLASKYGSSYDGWGISV